MRTMRRNNLVLFCAVLCLLVDGAVCGAQTLAVEAITKPSKDATLSFVRPGLIKEILVKQGDTVRPGQALAQLDDSAEQAELASLKAQADDLVRVHAAEAQLAQKKVDLTKYERAAKTKAATDLEVEHAKLEVVIAELSLLLAKFQRAQDGRKYAQAKMRVLRMRLLSPLAGKVEHVLYEKGESVNALEEVVRVVNIDPLWIDAPVPLPQARPLKVGQKLNVTFSHGRTLLGRIINIASVADAASSTLRVRVEVPNRSARPAGERVKISLSTPPTAAKTGTTATGVVGT